MTGPRPNVVVARMARLCAVWGGWAGQGVPFLQQRSVDIDQGTHHPASRSVIYHGNRWLPYGVYLQVILLSVCLSSFFPVGPTSLALPLNGCHGDGLTTGGMDIKRQVSDRERERG